jgi:Branched-chain amino acid transport protein (AzlD)
MSPTWIVIVALAVASAALKALGPASVGRRALSPRVTALTALLAPALLGGLVVYESVGATSGPGLAFDARLVGLGVAVVGLALRLPLLVLVVLAAGGTALTRALAG